MNSKFSLNIHNNTKKNNDRKTSMSKSLLIPLLVLSTLIMGSLLSYSIISISAQQDTTTLSNTQIKKSVTHNAVGHESHKVVQFVEPLNNTLYKGIVTFTSSIPIDIIAYHDISNIADKLNKTVIKPWIANGKTFVPTTIMKNATSGTVDFIGSGVTTHIPYNQTYDVAYSIHAIPFNIK